MPAASFPIKSIIVVASSCPQVKVHFVWKMKKIPCVIPPTYIDYANEPVLIEKSLNEILGSNNYHAKRVQGLPEKLLAVRSGLSVYGKNNISYVDGMGSFALISAYYSDLPCTEDYWHDIKTMKACEHCSACLQKCPTGAITNEGYLIKAQRCITYYNEFVTVSDFPCWLHPSSHNCIVGCMHCQICCPQNREYLNNVIELAEFDEQETILLLKGHLLENLPSALVSKLKQLNMVGYYNHLAQNLKALFDKEE